MINVMLIDDHPVVRAGLRSIIDGFEDLTVVAEASSGAGIDVVALTRDKVDVVVTDIQMPGVDGISLIKNIAADGPPILVLTTYDTEADIFAALEAGAMGYVLKDVPEQGLHDAIVATSKRARTLAPAVATKLADRVLKPRQALSAREIEILKELETGATNKQLASKLFISEATVKTHLVHIYSKLGVDNRTAAITQARGMKMI